MNYGRALRIARAARGINQQILAKRAGIGAHNISHIERHEMTPSNERVDALCAALEIPRPFFDQLAKEPGDPGFYEDLGSLPASLMTWISTAKDESQC